VFEIAADTVATAEELLKTLGAKELVSEDLESSVAALFDQDEEPAPEPEETPAPPATPTD
jgi:hypothetical protein